MAIPKDLQRVAKKYILKRVMIFTLILAVMCVATVFLNNRMSQSIDTAYKISSYIFCVFISLLLAGVPHKLLNKTFYGRVVKVEVETTIDNSSSVKPTRENLYYKNTVYLTVETSPGKTIRRKAYEARADTRSECDRYKAGDMVFHLYGTKHTIVIPNELCDTVRCPVCGEANSKDRAVCRSCGHSLIKFLDK